ncbi:MAG TPA: hypothetical protein VFF74_11770 [Methylophilaceae bacterium]|nr:hypothetical protein [Methylophilaceae bacterium]
MQFKTMQFNKALLAMLCLLNLNLLCLHSAQAQVLPEAVVGVKIPLAKKPTTRPMTVAYVPMYGRYYIADGGLAPLPGDMESPFSKSQVHVYSEDGKYLQSGKPGLDNRSIYFNSNTKQLESITYNVSSGAGFTPNTGIFSLDLTENGDLKETYSDVFGFNPAFGDAGTMPTYDADNKRYFAKQERSNLVWVVDLAKREKIAEIALDLAAAEALHDDVSDHYVAYTGMPGEELVLLDVDHKAALVYNLNGKLVGKSRLPATMKLRSQNHFNGLGYANGMLFVYHEPEGEFGTYYGFKVLDSVK